MKKLWCWLFHRGIHFHGRKPEFKPIDTGVPDDILRALDRVKSKMEDQTGCSEDSWE